MIFRDDLRRIARELDDVIAHNKLSLGDRRAFVVLTKLSDEVGIQCYATQKLCVRFHSVKAVVRRRHHRRDHLVLTPLEWKLG